METDSAKVYKIGRILMANSVKSDEIGKTMMAKTDWIGETMRAMREEKENDKQKS